MFTYTPGSSPIFTYTPGSSPIFTYTPESSTSVHLNPLDLTYEPQNLAYHLGTLSLEEDFNGKHVVGMLHVLMYVLFLCRARCRCTHHTLCLECHRDRGPTFPQWLASDPGREHQCMDALLMASCHLTRGGQWEEEDHANKCHVHLDSSALEVEHEVAWTECNSKQQDHRQVVMSYNEGFVYSVGQIITY